MLVWIVFRVVFLSPFCFLLSAHFVPLRQDVTEYR